MLEYMLCWRLHEYMLCWRLHEYMLCWRPLTLTEPFQPRSKCILEKTSQTSGHAGKNFRATTFQVDWYNNYPWITLCTTSNLVFCHYCRKIKQKGLSTLNWKKALQRFKEHESSQGRKESMGKHILMRQPSATSQLTTQLKNLKHCTVDC